MRLALKFLAVVTALAGLVCVFAAVTAYRLAVEKGHEAASIAMPARADLKALAGTVERGSRPVRTA
jgi:hypothetical protein